MGARSAIVIGGGIGGLSAALQLGRAGLDVAVFEQREELSEVNTGLSLWAFAIRRLEQLGLGDQLPAVGQPIERLVHRSADGRPLGDVDVSALSARVGAPSYEVHRSKLQQLLADALGTEAITFDRRCTSVHQEGDTVRAEFEGGHSATADLLVGADGVHSVVRNAVPSAANTELRRTEIAVWRGTAAIDHDAVPAGLHLRVMGPAGVFGIARLSDELVRWYAGAPFPAQEPASGDEQKRSALERFRDWPDPVVDALQETPASEYLFNDTPHRPPLRTWSHSRVTLLGDAAHSSVPTLGISAGLAMEDAATLGECLGTSTGAVSGLRAYEAQRRRISARVVRTARLFGRVLMVQRQPALRLREMGARIAPQDLAVRWIVGGARLR